MSAKHEPLPEFTTLADPTRRDIEATFAGILEAVVNSTLIAVIRERVGGFRSSIYPALLGRATAPSP